VNIAIYFIKNSPSFALNFKAPMEEWSRKPTYYDHLRVLSVLAFASVKKDKLEARAEVCIFIE